VSGCVDMICDGVRGWLRGIYRGLKTPGVKGDGICRSLIEDFRNCNCKVC